MKAASCGSIDAMYRLGSAYLYRELGLNSVPKGIKYLDKATVLGHGEAAYKLSNIYETGIEGYLDKSENLALHYLQESAELSYTPALDKLGWTYENGRLVNILNLINYKYNYSYFQQNLICNYIYFNYFFFFKKGNVKDSSKAFYYYMKASNNGYSQSMYSLAGLIMDNANIDDRLAYDWMLKATMVTEPLYKAFYGMGVFYEYGVGVAKNLVAALDWYKKARDNNVPDAEQKIKDLEYKINATLSDNSQTSSDKSNLEDNKTNVNSNNRESLAVSNYSSEYTYSPIVMPSPAISVKKENKNQNVIITKDQLKDMNLTINSDGKVVYLNNKSSEEVVDPEMTHSSTNTSTQVNINSNLMTPPVEGKTYTSPTKNIYDDNVNDNKRLSTNSIITKKLADNVEIQLIEDENKEYTIIPPKRTCHPALSPISSSSSIKLNSENINAIMEPAKQTEKDIKKLSVDVSGKVVVVNVDANDVEQEKFYKPKLFKMDSQGNIESLSASSSTFNTNNNGVSEDELKNDMEEKLNISNDDKKKEQHVVLNVPDSYSLDSNNLIIPTRLSSYAIANDKEQFEAANSNSNEQTFVNNGEDNENDNDYYGDDDDNDDKDNEDEQFLNADDDNNDPFTDITSEFKYDPVKLNSDSIDNINESSKIKASKSVKTYIALPKRYESHTNPSIYIINYYSILYFNYIIYI